MTASTALETPFQALERLAPLIREHADESEAQATLARPVVDGLIQAGLFRQLTPASLGGGECDPVEWYEIVEAASRVDGSAGWCVFINGATGLMGRTMQESEAETLLGNPKTVLAGSVFPFNKAVAVEGGYRVTGRWPFASGCKHATDLMGFCAVHDGDTPRPGPMGMPDIRIMLVPAAEATIVDTWDVVGLSGTGSHDIVFDNVFVPEARAISFAPLPPNRHYAGPLYRVPFMAMFAWPMGAVALGIAQHAIDIVTELSKTKAPAGAVVMPLNERPLFQSQLADATAAVRSARAWLHEAIGGLRAIAEAGGAADLQARVNAQLAASNATRSARAAVELMFLAAGGTAVYSKNELQRCMRDMHAVSQHVATGPATWETSGALLAGRPPQNPFILL
jgi:alkylation response protein AidB-like acyl-CoA dehydrogenase